MPAPRPDHDALAVWLCVNAEFGDGGLKSAFGALHDRMRPHALRRGVGPSIDTKDGGVAGDKMAEATIKNLYHQAQRRMAKDERLQARMILHSAQLRAALDKAPGSYLFPWRGKSQDATRLDGWVIAQQFPQEERLALHSDRDLHIAIAEADDPNGPNGPFTPI